MATAEPYDPRAFRDFERSRWQAVAEQYDNAYGSLTRQAIEPLLDALAVGKDARLLDVATGPGYVAAAAAKRGAKPVGIDFSAAMVGIARRRFPEIEFCEGDAENLPFPVGAFDRVTLSFALLHLAHPERALAEAYRVLDPQGRIGFTVWAKPEEAVGFGMVYRAIETYGRTDVSLPAGPPFFRFSEPEECARSLREAGFAQPHIARVPLLWRLRSPEGVFDAMLEGSARTGALLKAQSPEALNAIRQTVREEAEAYRKGAAIECPMPAVLASAVKS